MVSALAALATLSAAAISRTLKACLAAVWASKWAAIAELLARISATSNAMKTVCAASGTEAASTTALATAMRAFSSLSAVASWQGRITLVHFSAQLKRILGDRGALRGCVGGVQ